MPDVGLREISAKRPASNPSSSARNGGTAHPLRRRCSRPHVRNRRHRPHRRARRREGARPQARYRNNGSLRPSSGDSGIAVTSLGATDDVAEALAIDGNRAYIAGWSGTQLMLAKYDFDGDLASAFDGDGIVQRSVGTEARALAVTVEQDGSVLAAGWASMGGAMTFLVLHHLADGSPDSTIGTDGVVTTGIGSGTAAAEGVIALADESRMAVGWAANGSDDDVALVRYLHSPRCGNGIPEAE